MENMINDTYVFNKYPHLALLFSQYRLDGERWSPLVREVLYPKDNLRYMYDRTMQLIRRFGKGRQKYFDVKTELGTYTLPDRLSDFNRLMELYFDFFYDIYPNIMRKLSFDVLFQETKRGTLSGRVNWAKTIRQSISQGNSTTPLSFIVTNPEYKFENPENILTLASVLRLEQDASFLLKYNFVESITLEEQAILDKIIEGCNNILRTTIMQEIITMASKFSKINIDDSRIMLLENQVYSRLKGRCLDTDPYMNLLHWRQKYRELNLRLVSKNRTNFLFERRENLDKMFELWILFEFLDYLQTYEGAAVIVSQFPNHFQISIGPTTIDFFYEKYYTGWAANANPDFSIEKDGELKIIMDAKNWSKLKYEAIYKMLGYLNNLDGTIGMLFFPNSLYLDRTICHGTNLKHHKDQLLFNCVLKPSKSSKTVNEKRNAFKQIKMMAF